MHGLIHLLGFAKAFGLADLPQLAQPISRTWGALWLAAGMLVLAAAALLPLAPRWWWAVGAVAVVASQAVIFSSWGDAKFGTVANVVLLLGGLGLQPAVLAAKNRWVYPRTGRVTYPDHAKAPAARSPSVSTRRPGRRSAGSREARHPCGARSPARQLSPCSWASA